MYAPHSMPTLLIQRSLVTAHLSLSLPLEVWKASIRDASPSSILWLWVSGLEQAYERTAYHLTLWPLLSRATLTVVHENRTSEGYPKVGSSDFWSHAIVFGSIMAGLATAQALSRSSYLKGIRCRVRLPIAALAFPSRYLQALSLVA